MRSMWKPTKFSQGKDSLTGFFNCVISLGAPARVSRAIAFSCQPYGVTAVLRNPQKGSFTKGRLPLGFLAHLLSRSTLNRLNQVSKTFLRSRMNEQADCEHLALRPDSAAVHPSNGAESCHKARAQRGRF